MKKRVLFIIDGYPCLSQTYKENEIKYASLSYEIVVASFGSSPAKYRSHHPYLPITSTDDLKKIIREFQPDIIHGHYFHNLPLLDMASRMAGGTPFTIRTHSYDLINIPPERLKELATYSKSSRCYGIICFPFLRSLLTQVGGPESAIVADFPVVDYSRFYDRSQNGSYVFNTGAMIPKKDIASYARIASLQTSKRFLYCPVGHNNSSCERNFSELNSRLGSPVDLIANVEPYDMPKLYKSCEWLVYTANSSLATVGWPMAIAEAQASGCGVLMQNIRPDIQDYIGGAGFVFNEITEAVDILSSPYPSELRELGFKLAKRSDIRVNIQKLFRLWEK